MRKGLPAVVILVAAILSMVPGIVWGEYGGGPAPGISNPLIRVDITGVHVISPQEVCPSCSIFTTQPFMAPSINEEEETVSVSMGVIDAGGLSPVEGATIFAYVQRQDGSNAQAPCRVYTNENGSAKISYNPEECRDGCTTKFFFCCADPVALACVLEPCLGQPVAAYTDIPACAGYGGEWPSPATIDGEEVQLYPTLETAFIPPQTVLPEFDYTFTLCFPLLVIFGFLGAAMYASGRDPFAMFSFYTPRFTRGAERPIQGRGYTIPGSSIINVAMKATDLATGKTTAKEMFTSSMEQSSMIAKTKGATGELGSGTGSRAAAGRAGAAAEETSRTSADRMAAGGGSGAVLGMSLGVSEQMMRPGAAGVGVGTALLALLGIMLRFSNAPWLTGGLAQKLIGIAEAWQAERVASYAQTYAAPISSTVQTQFDSEGYVAKLTYRDPQSGQTIVVEGREACAAFIDSVTTGLYLSSQAGSNAATELMSNFNERIANLQHPTAGARELLRVEVVRAEGPAEVLDALGTLADLNSSAAKRREALEIVAGSDQVSEDVKIAAFVAATEGMTYHQFAQFVGAEGTAANRIFLELVSNSAALNERLDGKIDGNMLGALGAAAERLEQLNGSRREGQADSLGLGTSVVAIRSGIGECHGDADTFVFRQGTEEAAAKMAAMGLSGAALDTRISFDEIGGQRVVLGHIQDDEVRAEIEAATDSEGNIDISKLSGKARSELGDVINYQLREAVVSEYNTAYSVQQEADFKNGDSDEAKAVRAFQDALGNYEAASQSSYSLIDRYVTGPAMAEVGGLLDSNPNPVDSQGRLTTMVLPEHLAADDVKRIMQDHGVDPELASIVAGISGAEAQANFATGLREGLGSLTMGPAEFHGQNADKAYGDIGEVDRQLAEFNAAVQTLQNPDATAEAKEQARGIVAAGALIVADHVPDDMGNLIPVTLWEHVQGEASRIMGDQNASQADKQWAQEVSGINPETALSDERQVAVLWQEYNTHMGEQKDALNAEMESSRNMETIFALGPPLDHPPSNEQERIVAQERESALRAAVEQYATSAYSQAEAGVTPDIGQIILGTMYGNPNEREMLDEARSGLPPAVQGQLDVFLSDTASDEEKSSALTVLVPALDTYYRYAENPADDRLTAADRGDAQWAVHTLQNSEDLAARAQAADVLKGLRGVSAEAQPGIDALVATANVPPSQFSEEQKASLGTAAPVVQERLDIYFDTVGLDRAVSDPDGTRLGLANDYAAGRQTELEQLRQYALDGGSAVGRAQYENAQIQISLLGNEAIEKFYADMNRNREIAEQAAKSISEHRPEGGTGEGAGGAGGQGGGTAYSSAARRTSESRSQGQVPDEEIPR
jgi:hypothetical protein